MSDTPPPPPPPPPYGGGQPTPPPPPPGHDSGVPGYGAPGYAQPGYGAPGYGAPGYGQPMYGATAPTRTNGMAVASLVLGILGVPTFCLPLASLLAVIFGWIGISQCKKDPTYTGRGLAIAGVILGALMLLAFIAIIVVARTADPVTWDLGE